LPLFNDDEFMKIQIHQGVGALFFLIFYKTIKIGYKKYGLKAYY